MLAHFSLRNVFSNKLVPLHLDKQVRLDDANSVQQLRNDPGKRRFTSAWVALEDHVILSTRLHFVPSILTLLVQDHGMVKLSYLLLQQLKTHNLGQQQPAS